MSPVCRTAPRPKRTLPAEWNDQTVRGCDMCVTPVSRLLRSVPTAILSRQAAGIRGHSLVINLPGKPAAIRDCLLAVFPAVPYCIDLIDGPALQTNDAVVKAFRPRTN